jgi:hypothetical protein
MWASRVEEEFVEHVRTGLQSIVLGVLRDVPSEEAAMLGWPLVCGPSVAAKTRAMGCDKGVLRVEVADKAWRSQLQELLPRYAAAMKKIAGVEHIEFVLPGFEASLKPRN